MTFLSPVSSVARHHCRQSAPAGAIRKRVRPTAESSHGSAHDEPVSRVRTACERDDRCPSSTSTMMSSDNISPQRRRPRSCSRTAAGSSDGRVLATSNRSPLAGARCGFVRGAAPARADASLPSVARPGNRTVLSGLEDG